ncbi:MAG: pentapeptide repeat-containing protein, partial [Pseudomonadota bacterium]
SSVEMQGADLSGAAMQGAFLLHAEMKGANLSFAEMQGASLLHAAMQGANLSFAEMQGADLSSAEMQGADLSFAGMQGASLSGAEMQGAILSSAKMQGTILRGAEVQGADLSGAEMQGASLRRAEVQGAILFRAEMQGAACDGATLRGAPSHAATLLCQDLRPEALEFATGNGVTRLPIGVAVQSCLEAPETTLPDDVKSAFDDLITVLPSVSREDLFAFLTCDPAADDPLKRTPFPIEGTWEAQEDGSWINTVDMLDGTPAGTVHAEGPDGKWRDIPPKK